MARTASSDRFFKVNYQKPFGMAPTEGKPAQSRLSTDGVYLWPYFNSDDLLVMRETCQVCPPVRSASRLTGKPFYFSAAWSTA